MQVQAQPGTCEILSQEKEKENEKSEKGGVEGGRERGREKKAKGWVCSSVLRHWVQSSVP